MRPTLEEIGRAVYGGRWRGKMALELDVSDRTLDRWAAGSREIPDGAWQDLRAIVRDEYGDCELLNRMEGV
jgi:hypothetical protein